MREMNLGDAQETLNKLEESEKTIMQLVVLNPGEVEKKVAAMQVACIQT